MLNFRGICDIHCQMWSILRKEIETNLKFSLNELKLCIRNRRINKSIVLNDYLEMNDNFYLNSANICRPIFELDSFKIHLTFTKIVKFLMTTSQYTPCQIAGNLTWNLNFLKAFLFYQYLSTLFSYW